MRWPAGQRRNTTTSRPQGSGTQVAHVRIHSFFFHGALQFVQEMSFKNIFGQRWADSGLGEEEEEEEDLFVFNDTTEGPRAPAVKPGRITQAYESESCSPVSGGRTIRLCSLWPSDDHRL